MNLLFKYFLLKLNLNFICNTMLFYLSNLSCNFLFEKVSWTWNAVTVSWTFFFLFLKVTLWLNLCSFWNFELQLTYMFWVQGYKLTDAFSLLMVIFPLLWLCILTFWSVIISLWLTITPNALWEYLPWIMVREEEDFVFLGPVGSTQTLKLISSVEDDNVLLVFAQKILMVVTWVKSSHGLICYKVFKADYCQLKK